MHTNLQPVTAGCIRMMVSSERSLGLLATAPTGHLRTIKELEFDSAVKDLTCHCLVDEADPKRYLALTVTKDLDDRSENDGRRTVLIKYVEVCRRLSYWYPSVREVMIANAIMNVATVLHEDGISTTVGLETTVGPIDAINETLAGFSADPEHTTIRCGQDNFVFPVIQTGVVKAANILREAIEGRRQACMTHGLGTGTTYVRRMALTLPPVTRFLESEIALYADDQQKVDWRIAHPDVAQHPKVGRASVG
ncbi:hypothetical protein [Novosphingopyxis sp.]|uniref:hypothetical protein n=1 Tax=Novosphingopyxis sp. TaxID=2709690 RepID=UPI003B5B4D2F